MLVEVLHESVRCFTRGPLSIAYHRYSRVNKQLIATRGVKGQETQNDRSDLLRQRKEYSDRINLSKPYHEQIKLAEG